MSKPFRIFSPGALLLALIMMLIGLPVVTVLAQLFLPGAESWNALLDTVLPGYVANSLWLVLGVGSGVFVVGTGTAWLVTMTDFPGRRYFEWALILPLAAPAYVLAYAYTDFLQVSGPVQSLIRDMTGLSPRAYWFPEIRSLGGAIFVFVLALYPYVYLAARAAFIQQSECVVEASRTLGATAWESFYRVALPLARPALAAGVTLALMETLADFGAVSYFGVPTFTTGIYRSWFSFGDRVAAAQLASVLLAFVAILMFVEKLSRRQARYYETSRRTRPLGVQALDGVRRVLAVLACLVPLFFGFLLPAMILGYLAFFGGDVQLGARYISLVQNSVSLAGITAFLAVFLALAVSYAVRLQSGVLIRAAAWLAGLGYAIPGSIIAVGVLIPLSGFDNWLDSLTRIHFDISTGLLLTGSVAALVFAYLVRFLALAKQTVQAGLEKVTPSMDAAAYSLGAGRLQTLFRVHVPLMRGSLFTAFLMVFVEVMKELPATLIMRPFNFDTLAVQAHNLAADERLAEAATPALTLLLVGLIPVVIISRLIGRSRPGAPKSGRNGLSLFPNLRRAT